MNYYQINQQQKWVIVANKDKVKDKIKEKVRDKAKAKEMAKTKEDQIGGINKH